MPSKCKHPECKSEAGYNFSDKKDRVFLKKHTEPGMVSNRVSTHLMEMILPENHSVKVIPLQN